jgi:hypothetical protein
MQSVNFPWHQDIIIEHFQEIQHRSFPAFAGRREKAQQFHPAYSFFIKED